MRYNWKFFITPVCSIFTGYVIGSVLENLIALIFSIVILFFLSIGKRTSQSRIMWEETYSITFILTLIQSIVFYLFFNKKAYIIEWKYWYIATFVASIILVERWKSYEKRNASNSNITKRNKKLPRGKDKNR